MWLSNHASIFAMAGIVLGFFASEADAACAQASEYQAVQSRVLQTELMVGALACKQSGIYNEFIKKHDVALRAHGKAFRDYFERNYGKASGEAVMNQFVTKLANEASQGSLRVSETEFCQRVALLGQEAVEASNQDFPTIAMDFAPERLRDIQPCK